MLTPRMSRISIRTTRSYDCLTLDQKIRDRQLAAPTESDNIQDLCRNELKTKKHTATEGLLWLIR